MIIFMRERGIDDRGRLTPKGRVFGAGRNQLVNLALTGEGRITPPLQGELEQKRIEQVAAELTVLAAQSRVDTQGTPRRRW